MTDPTHQALIDGYRDGLKNKCNGIRFFGANSSYAYAFHVGYVDGGHAEVTRSQLNAAIASFREQEEKGRRAVNLLKG